MSYYQKDFFPKLTEVFLNNKVLNKERKKVLSVVRGQVLEVGFGSGLNLRFYPNEVESLVAVDPSEAAISLAKKRVVEVDYPVRLLYGTCETVDIPLASFDFIVTTWVLCMVENPQSTLKTMRKFLKPTGKYVFLEHGYSKSSFTRKIQDCCNPFSRKLLGGCNINRPIDTLIESAGFEIVELERFNLFGCGVALSAYRGIAIHSLLHE